MNTPTTDQQLHPAFTELEVCLGMLHDLGELQECEHDNAFVVAAESIQEEITGVLRRELSPDLQRWVERYAEVGSRNPFLWKWCCRGVEVTTLPCAQPDAPEELCDTKVL
ncbi:MAG: hypothetical protein ACE5FA_13870, partial [Dehalococcoidia bacterium]